MRVVRIEISLHFIFTGSLPNDSPVDYIKREQVEQLKESPYLHLFIYIYINVFHLLMLPPVLQPRP